MLQLSQIVISGQLISNYLQFVLLQDSWSLPTLVVLLYMLWCCFSTAFDGVELAFHKGYWFYLRKRKNILGHFFIFDMSFFVVVWRASFAFLNFVNFTISKSSFSKTSKLGVYICVYVSIYVYMYTCVYVCICVYVY